MKLHLYRSSVLLLCVLLLSTACKKEYESIDQIDSKEIENYLSQNNLTGFKDTLGVKYKVIQAGNGELLRYDSIVPIIFTVKSLDGKYSSLDTFALSNRYGSGSISGVATAEYLGYFGAEKNYPNVLKSVVRDILKRSGGEVKVIVPSRLAFGREGFGSIAGNTSLEYNLRVLNKVKIAAYDALSIQKYITANNLTGFTQTPSGLWYKIINAGTGSTIKKDSTITFKSTGRLFNGSIFYQTQEGSPATEVLANLVPGWQEGLPFIKEGGSIRLIIPSRLGYGFFGSRNYDQFTGKISGIPPVACLDFEVEVVDISPTVE